jgi:oligoribonuclease
VAASDRNLVWMDLEMSGLDPDQCVILEIATIVTREDLKVVAEGPDLVIHHEPEALATLSGWSREHFGASGLLDRVARSTVSLHDAEERTLAFLREHCSPQSSPLCGNSVHMDRSFLWRGMRRLHDFLHYRNVDVSTLKELLRRWYPTQFAPPEKASTHVALTDVRESIAELRYYRETFLCPVSESPRPE